MRTAVPDIQSLRIGYFADDKLIIDQGGWVGRSQDMYDGRPKWLIEVMDLGMYITRGASSTILPWHDSRIDFSFLMSSRDRKHFRSKVKQSKPLEMPQVFCINCSCAKKPHITR